MCHYMLGTYWYRCAQLKNTYSVALSTNFTFCEKFSFYKIILSLILN